MDAASYADLTDLQRRYPLEYADLDVKTYLPPDRQLDRTDCEISHPDYGIRSLRDRISRDLIGELDAAHIGIASSTYDIVGLPPIEVHLSNSPAT